MRSKRYQKIRKSGDFEAQLQVEEAITKVKESASAKFEENMEVAFRLGMSKQKEQFVIRGSIELPHFQSKKKSIVAFVSDESKSMVDKLKKVGAKDVGGEKLVEKVVKEGKLDADIVVADPSMMPKIAKAARILGPKGLMPSPKAGTISKDLEALITKISQGNQIEIRSDKTGNIHAVIGKVKQDSKELHANFKTLLNFITKQKPENWKGEYLMKVSLSSTMGPSVRVVA